MNRFLLIFLFLAMPFLLLSQDYKEHAGVSYLKDTVVYKGYKITPGDTLLLGKGSDENGEFKFVQLIDMSKFGEGSKVLPAKYFNSFLIFKGIEERTAFGHTFPDYSFYFNNNYTKQAFVRLGDAFKNNELQLPPRKFVGRNKRKRGI